jgi:hypothetical protein
VTQGVKIQTDPLPSAQPDPLLGSPKQPNHNPCGHPIVVLVDIDPERSPVVIEINQAHLKVSRRLEIQSPAHFHRKTVLRSRVTARSADGGVRARTSDKGFRKRRQTPSISSASEHPRSVMISINDILGVPDGYHAVAGVGNQLQPRLYVPAKRPHYAVQVGPRSTAAVQSRKAVAAK